MRDYKKDYDEFWADIVSDGKGGMDPDKVKRELCDYHNLMDAAVKVYEHFSGLTKTNTDPQAVIDIGEERFMEHIREVTGKDILGMLEHSDIDEETMRDIQDYFS